MSGSHPVTEVDGGGETGGVGEHAASDAVPRFENHHAASVSVLQLEGSSETSGACADHDNFFPLESGCALHPRRRRLKPIN